MLTIFSRNVLITYHAMKRSNSTSRTAISTVFTPSSASLAQPPSSRTVCRRGVLTGVDRLLRQWGFYGHFVTESSTISSETRICVGYYPPAWFCSKTISLELEIKRFLTGETGIEIGLCRVRIRNRVPLDASFMVACLRGDVRSIQQHLADGTGHVGNRAMCSGKTPLLVSRIRPRLVVLVMTCQSSWPLRVKILMQLNTFSKQARILTMEMTIKCQSDFTLVNWSY